MGQKNTAHFSTSFHLMHVVSTALADLVFPLPPHSLPQEVVVERGPETDIESCAINLMNNFYIANFFFSLLQYRKPRVNF